MRHSEWVDAASHLRAAYAVADEFDTADRDLLPNLGIATLHLQDDEAVLRFHTLDEPVTALPPNGCSRCWWSWRSRAPAAPPVPRARGA